MHPPVFFMMTPQPPRSTLFPYTTLFRSREHERLQHWRKHCHERGRSARSEEHTSELQSHHDLVCRLLLEKKNKPWPFPNGLIGHTVTNTAAPSCCLCSWPFVSVLSAEVL